MFSVLARGDAPPGRVRSKREDMTGHRGPRQTVARPASRITTAPATAAARQGAPAKTARPAPEMTIPCTAPPVDAPLVVDPPRGPSRVLARAAASTAAACAPADAATAAPAPRTASRAPTARLATDLVAITAARQASAASASALASGTSCCPLTEMSCAGSGRGGVKMAWAQAWRTASTTSPAPTAPASSTSTNSLRFIGISGRHRGCFPGHRRKHGSVETGPVASVAGGADLVDLDHEGVAVAVERYRLHPLVVPGRVALDPVLLPAARPVGTPARGEGAMQRLVVHPAEHQHLTGVVLLSNGRDQAGRVALKPCRDGRVEHRSLLGGSGSRTPG